MGGWGARDSRESIICVCIYLLCDYVTVSREQMRKEDKVSTWMTKFVDDLTLWPIGRMGYSWLRIWA